VNLTDIQIAPSVISADFLNLGASLGAVERAGADMFHFDVMDGQFVPNITMGPLVLQAIKRQLTVPIDVHLMIVDPDRYLADFAKAGADILIVHQEAVTHLHRTVAHIHSLGCKAGVAINPATPIALLEDILDDLDTVLVMSVNPGFGGQTFIPRSESKIAALRALIARRGARARIEVDGGVDPDTAPRVVAAGAQILVAGNSVLGQPDPVAAFQRLRAAATASAGVGAVGSNGPDRR
jgi:ribulose-phosphate 3-epimerase